MTCYILIAALLASCGGASAGTRTAYSVAVAQCVARERSIVDRTGTTEEQDRADLAAEREECDHNLARIEGSTP